MPLPTEQPRKRKHTSQTVKNSTKQKKSRFLNMSPKQVRKRYQRMKQREYRKALLQRKHRRAPSKADAAKARPRKARPCCGLHSMNCSCKPPARMRKSYLNALSRRFTKTALASVQDTTDVSTFQTFMAKHCKTLPLRVLLAYAHTHTLCSIKTTCCRASLSRRRSYSSRRGLTGNCCRALSRSLSKQVNDFALRITEAQ